MGSETLTCQWKRLASLPDKYKCGLSLDSGHSSLCILHDPNPDKSSDRFNQALKEQIREDEEREDSDLVNLSGVVFPDMAVYSDRIFEKFVNFSHARFAKGATFSRAQFKEGADFSDSQFGDLAVFDNAKFGCKAFFVGTETKFNKRVSFSDAQFTGTAEFFYVEFCEQANFYGAQFSREAHVKESKFRGEVNFSRASIVESLTFEGPTFLVTKSDEIVSFQDLSGESARKIRFEGADLSRASFLRTDVSQTRFVGCTWPYKTTFKFWPKVWHALGQFRSVIYDEISLDKRRKSGENVRTVMPAIGTVYRQLQLNLEASREESEAGDFYVGMMEMRRQQLPSYYPWIFRQVLRGYRVLAKYGESFGRPLMLYLFSAGLFAAVYLKAGFTGVGNNAVQYTLGLGLPNGWDYLQALFHALTAGGLIAQDVTFHSEWVPMVRYLNGIWDVLLLALLVIALRRHFRR
jgi:uncharacterized protein YjbI with pentapeptide repeats